MSVVFVDRDELIAALEALAPGPVKVVCEGPYIWLEDRDRAIYPALIARVDDAE